MNFGSSREFDSVTLHVEKGVRAPPHSRWLSNGMKIPNYGLHGYDLIRAA